MAVLVLYLVAGSAWVYAGVDRDNVPVAAWIGFFLVHAALGLATGRWWTLVLPLLLPLLAIPAGEDPDGGDIDEVWVEVFITLHLWIGSMAAGIAIRKAGGAALSRTTRRRPIRPRRHR